VSSVLDRQRERFQANPGDRRAFEALEEALFVSGDWDGLVAHYDHRLTAPELAEAPAERALLLLRLGQVWEERRQDPGRAAECFRGAVRSRLPTGPQRASAPSPRPRAVGRGPPDRRGRGRPGDVHHRARGPAGPGRPDLARPPRGPGAGPGAPGAGPRAGPAARRGTGSCGPHQSGPRPDRRCGVPLGAPRGAAPGSPPRSRVDPAGPAAGRPAGAGRAGRRALSARAHRGPAQRRGRGGTRQDRQSFRAVAAAGRPPGAAG
jgi:hypothetical protein